MSLQNASSINFSYVFHISLLSDEFIWFADEPKIDAMVNMEQKVCLHTLTINIRVPTRSDDIDSQIRQGNLVLY